MKRFFLILPIFLIVTGFTSELYAWSVNYDFQAKKIKIKANATVENIHPYLVWADLTNSRETKFLSLVKDRGWVNDILPVVLEPIDLPAFGEVELGSLPAECAEGHKCYLFMVAVEAGHEPSEFEAWKKFSIFPLSIEAAMERFPGQSSFVANSSGYREEIMPLAAGAADTTTSSNSDSEPSQEQPDTEKPDIFKIDGSKIFYANARANKFQVIDWSLPSEPNLVSSLPMKGTPKELYALNGHYILLMNKNNSYRDGITLLESYSLKNEQLEIGQSLQVEGYFIESRRRDNFIYLITRSTSESIQLQERTTEWHPSSNDLMVIAIEITPQGHLVEKARKRINGLPYHTVTAIFPDYLIYAHRDFEHGTTSSIVTIFDISNPNNPLPEPKTLKVTGIIPSEFHMDIKDDMLRLVSSPDSWEEDSGSSLWIFDLSQNPPLRIGSLKDIAPGEQLFATRFEDNRAYVVTYERRDPLWVIDISNPRRPKILGHLEVPGWSDKLFIHGEKLFSLGTYDQPIAPDDEPDGWYRRVAASMFDVSEPSNPELISRIVPLADKGHITYSLALDDERALLLDWDKQFCAFPLKISSYESRDKNYLQICKFNNGTIEDVGAALVPIQLERPLYLEDKLLGGLGSLGFYTIDWHATPEVIGSVELARDFIWLDYHNGLLWAATSLEDWNIFKLFGFRPDNLEEPVHTFNLDKKYSYIDIDGDYALFYNRSPLKITLLNLKSGSYSEEYSLEEPSNSSSYYGNLIFKNDKIYVLENEMIDPADPRPATDLSTLPSCVRPYYVKFMKVWKTQGEDHQPELIVKASVPGQLIGVTSNNKLIFKEPYDNKLLLHLVDIEDGQPVLKKSRSFECASWSANALLTESDKLFLTCAPYDPYPIVIMEEETDSANIPERSIMPMRESKLFAIEPESLEVKASLKLRTDAYIQDGFSDLVLINEQGYIRPLGAESALETWESRCAVYKFTGNAFQLVKRLSDDICNARDFALSDTMLFTAYGLEGLTKTLLQE